MWERFTTQKKKNGLVALGLYPHGVAVVRAERLADARVLVSAAEFRLFGAEEPVKVLARVSSDYGLKRQRCSVLLHDGEYRLIQTEAPDVKVEELKSALRWRIKDLIDFHVNDATLDVFDVPGLVPGRLPSVYVVVARNETIRRISDWAHEASIDLDVIDIPELAQRNLAGLSAQDEAGMALLTTDNDAGLITITRAGQLYLSRPLPGGITAWQDAAGRERILLELQRSLDYFESFFRQSPIMYVAIAPTTPETETLVTYLRTQLTQQVDFWNPERPVTYGAGVVLPESCLLTFGAALRDERIAL